LIFVWLPTSVHGESFPKDVLPEEMYMGLREQAGAGAQYFIRELPYSFDMLVVDIFMYEYISTCENYDKSFFFNWHAALSIGIQQ